LKSTTRSEIKKAKKTKKKKKKSRLSLTLEKPKKTFELFEQFLKTSWENNAFGKYQKDDKIMKALKHIISTTDMKEMLSEQNSVNEGNSINQQSSIRTKWTPNSKISWVSKNFTISSWTSTEEKDTSTPTTTPTSKTSPLISVPSKQPRS
jgi:hypothetical protein